MSFGCQAICHRQLLKSIRNCVVEGKYDPFNDAEMIFEDDVGGMPVSRMYWRWHHHCFEQCSHQLFICFKHEARISL